jgi:hypothetical protein
MKRWLLIAVLAFLSIGLQAQKNQLWHPVQDNKQQQKFQLHQPTQLPVMKSDIRQARLNNPTNRKMTAAIKQNKASFEVNDSLYEFKWDSIGNVWPAKAFYRELYTYNYQGNQTGILYSKRNYQGRWRNLERNTSFFNNSGDNIVWIDENWDTINNAWIPIERDTITYNSKHIILKEKWYYYNTTNQKWFIGEYHQNNDAGFELVSYYYNWNPQTFVLTGGFRYTRTLNAFNKPLEEIDQDYNPATTNWDNFSRDVYAYTQDTLVATLTTSQWTGTAWLNSDRTTNTYSTTGGFLQQEVNETWDVTTSAWIGVDRTTYTYVNKLETVVLQELWDKTSQKWVNDHRTTNTYQNNLLSVEVKEIWDNTLTVPAWVNDKRITDTYQGTHLSVTLTEQWNSALPVPAWENFSRSSITYYADNTVQEILGQTWLVTWVDVSRILFNSKGQLTETWYKFLTFGYRVLYEYDQSGNKTVVTTQNWNVRINNWQNTLKDVYYYSPFTDIKNPNPEAMACEFRNPYLPGTLIHCTMLKSGEIYKLALYNMAGSCVTRQQINGSEPFSMDKSLPEGLYLLTIDSQQQRVYAKKLIIQKP